MLVAARAVPEIFFCYTMLVKIEYADLESEDGSITTGLNGGLLPHLTLQDESFYGHAGRITCFNI